MLDQRWQLQRNALQLNDAHSRQEHREGAESAPTPQTYAVQCLVIAGKMPRELELQKSFEFYRSELRGVTVITFDELLLKLQVLIDLLKVPDARAFAVPTVTRKELWARRGLRRPGLSSRRRR